ncbi:CST complex subunit CTC1-like isoform X2 [Thalassophryne amazonica]|nr:CST complex subunit CTC1-like isoform X2 [Thalassophryne amazonica]
MSVSEVLDCSSADVVCFQGLISDRTTLTDRTGTSPGVRLTLCDQSGRSIRVYMDLSHTPCPPGLLPGNTVLLSSFQRRRSRAGGVYCKMLPVSSLTVVKVMDASSAQPPPPPMMQLGRWALSTEEGCTVGRVKGHVVCVFSLQLQWKCSLCSAIYTQSCSSSRCPSTSAVFQSEAKLLLDDGTGEAHVWFSSLLIRPLLGLDESQWEGLQRALRVRGHIRIYMKGRSLMCDSPCGGALLQYLRCVCSSDLVCRSLSLTCRKRSERRSGEVKRFSRANTDFLTKLNARLELVCLHVH